MNKKTNDTIWQWIKHLLSLQGLNFNKLAAIHKVHITCFTGVRNKPIPKYERIIADYINAAPWELWPERYDASHNPNRVSSRYQGHKAFVEHQSQEINGKVSNGK
jgi:lambda repressor-like predicted transcriptional regulator